MFPKPNKVYPLLYGLMFFGVFFVFVCIITYLKNTSSRMGQNVVCKYRYKRKMQPVESVSLGQFYYDHTSCYGIWGT